MEPWLTNVEAPIFPKPHVKWSYETSHAQKTPAALMRAYAAAAAVQPPQGPVYLSLPLNDWAEESLGPAVVRTVCTRVAPDSERIAIFGEALNGAKRPVLIIGPDVERANAWHEAIQLAELVGGAVFASPAPERASSPEDHPLFAGGLPFGIAPSPKSWRASMSCW